MPSLLLSLGVTEFHFRSRRERVLVLGDDRQGQGRWSLEHAGAGIWAVLISICLDDLLGILFGHCPFYSTIKYVVYYSCLGFSLICNF